MILNNYLKNKIINTNMLALNEYKGMKYFLDKDNLWKVMINEDLFVVSLDDSKEESNRKINWKANKEQTCKKYIDWILN